MQFEFALGFIAQLRYALVPPATSIIPRSDFEIIAMNPAGFFTVFPPWRQIVQIPKRIPRKCKLLQSWRTSVRGTV